MAIKEGTVSKLLEIRSILEIALSKCMELPCECDRWNTYMCQRHSWGQTIEDICCQIDNTVKTIHIEDAYSRVEDAINSICSENEDLRDACSQIKDAVEVVCKKNQD